MKTLVDVSATRARIRPRRDWRSPYALDGVLPVLVADHVADTYGTTARAGFAALHGFARASPGWCFDAAGALAALPPGAPRFQHQRGTGTRQGLLLEGARSNRLPNSLLAGAATGLLSAGGALPTGWSLLGLPAAAVEVALLTPRDGLSRIRLRLGGTPTTADVYLHLCNPAQITATAGTPWVLSAFLHRTGGTLANLAGLRIQASGWTAAGMFVSGSTGAFVTADVKAAIGADLTRVTLPGSLVGAAVERLRPSLRLDTTGPLDLTLDICAPQAEQGTTVGSVIPTGAATVTRAADQLSLAALEGVFDIRVEEEGQVTDLKAQALSPGWWPAGRTGLLRRVLAFPPGTLP